MWHSSFRRFHAFLVIGLLGTLLFGVTNNTFAQTQRTPADVVREFYKAMHERRFKDAWSLTIYKPAVDGLSAAEMEDLRQDFEEKAAVIPETVEIASEQIDGASATVFVKVPINESTPQNISQPLYLIK